MDLPPQDVAERENACMQRHHSGPTFSPRALIAQHDRLDEVLMRYMILLVAAIMLIEPGVAATPAAPPSEKQVCAAGIGAMMGREPRTIITTRSDGNVHYQQYVRRNDGTIWKYKCTIEGQRVMWGADDGRWRRHERDEVLTFEWVSNKLIVREKGFIEAAPRVLNSYTLSQLPQK